MNRKALLGRIRRMTLQAVLTLAVIVILVFLLVRIIPGDPVRILLGTQYTPEGAEALRAQLNLNGSIVEQFGDYVGRLVQGDLGSSMSQRGRTVANVIGESILPTLSLVIVGIAIAVLVGVSLGLLAALTKRRGVDLAVRTTSMVAFSVPTFLVGLVLIYVFALTLSWFPAGGWPGSWPENLAYLVLPGIALSVHLATLITRTVRQGAIDASGQQFVEAAIARGLPARKVNVRHILPNSLLPVLTLVGISFGTLLTGAIIVEAVFGIPGLGAELTRAVSRRDYPVIQGVALITGFVVVVTGYVVELAYVLVDPRARTL